MNKISLCVPTYNRPETLKQLINSYRKQTYKNKELVISDDTPDSSVEAVVKEYKDKSIKYFHNKTPLRFSQNLRMSMKRATGKYLILLGDDDVLVDEDVLSRYVKTFDDRKNVGFIYSNMVQFSTNMEIESIITFSNKSKQFRKGTDGMKHMWIRSIYIGGIGIRNGDNLDTFYPTKKILHPQVEFIGNIINLFDSYLLAKTNIGFRSHDDQIIFRALKNKAIRQEGNHMTVELFEIFMNLKRKYQLPMKFDTIAKQLVGLQLVMLFKEKANLGQEEMEKNYKKFCELSDVAKKSLKLRAAFYIATMLPIHIIPLIRTTLLKVLTLKNIKENSIWKLKLLVMMS